MVMTTKCVLLVNLAEDRRATERPLWRRSMRRLGKRPRTTLALAFAVLLGSVPLMAQTHFASFTGTVTSKDGNPLPDAEVVATNVATKVAYTSRSNEAGVYT